MVSSYWQRVTVALATSLWATACTGAPPTDGKDPADDTDTDTLPVDTEETDATIDTEDSEAVVAAPEVRITLSRPTVADELVAEVVDPVPGATYLWSWTLNDVAQTDLTGDRVPVGRTRRGQTWAVRVRAQVDGVTSEPGTASVVIANAAPVATVVIDPVAPTALVGMRAVAGAEDADGDPVTFAYAWTMDGAPTLITTEVVPAASLARGQVWRVVATPNDGVEDGLVAEATVTVGNAAPVVQSVTLAPTDVRTNGTLTATAVRVDPDGDALTMEWTWYRNGAAIAGQAGTSLPGSAFDAGDEVWVVAQARDAALRSAPVESNRVVIANTPPDASNATISPASATRLDTLTCAGAGFVDIDGDPVGWSYRWLVDNAVFADQIGATLSAPAFAKGQRVACEAAPYDGTDNGPWLRSADVRIGNAPPSLAAVALSSSAPSSSEPLTAIAVDPFDPDGDRVDVAWRWFVNGQAAGTGEVLPASAIDAGDEVWVVGTPNDGEVSGSPVSSARALVGNAPPTVTWVEIGPEDAVTTTTLVATVEGADPDGQSVTFTWRWTVDDVDVPGAAASSLPGTHFQRGQRVRAWATPFDGFTSGVPAASNEVVILNSPPSLGGARVTPGAHVDEASVLSCEVTGFSDPDGDRPGWIIEWLIGDRSVTFFPTFDGTSFNRGDSVRCRATPTDGMVGGAPVVSPAVVVGNAPPSVASAELSTLAPTTATTLTVIPSGASDPDGDTITWRYRWEVNGVLVSTADQLPPDNFRPADVIQAFVRPFDGTEEGREVATSLAVVTNGAPSVTWASLAPTTPSIDDLVEVSWEGSDPDGDALEPIFTWYIGEDAVPGATGDTFTGFDRGDIIACAVQVTDGVNVSAPLLTAPVIAVNLPPVAVGVTASPSEVYESTTVTCTALGATDPEGDEIEWTYVWKRNGDPITDLQTIDGAWFDKGDRIQCFTAPDDGYPNGIGAEVASASILVRNTPPVLDAASLSTDAPVEATTLRVDVGASHDDDRDPVTPRVAWFVNGLQVATTATLNGSRFSRGDRITATVTPFDGEDEGVPVVLGPVTVRNTPPAVTQVFLDPAQPTAFDTLQAFATTADADGDPVSVTWVWYVSGNVVQSGPVDSLAPSLFTKGSDIFVMAIPNDGIEDGLQFASTTIRIDNTAPRMDGATISPAAVYEDTTVTCEGYGWTDPDGDPPGYAYSWKVNGAPDAEGPTIGGLRFKKGDALVCVATPWDGTSFGPPVESPAVTVLNTAPTATSVTLSRVDPVEGNTLFAIVEGQRDADGDAITTTWRWLVNGVEVSTAASLGSESFKRGDTIRCDVTLSDGQGSVVLSSNVVTVANSLPSVGSIALDPVAPYTNDTVTATITTSDADGDRVAVRFEWSVGGAVVPGVTGSTLAGTFFAKNQDIRVVAIPNDGIADGPRLTSATIRSVNSLPTLQTVSVTPSTLRRGQTSTCAATGGADADGDPVAVEYQWFINGQYHSTAISINPEQIRRGDTVYCVARPYDGEAYGPSLTTPTKTVANALPTVASVVLSSSAPIDGSTVTATVSPPVDADGDVVTLAYAWRVNGVQVSTDAAIDGNRFNRGDTLELVVTPNDRIDNGPATSSGVVTVVNALPVAGLPVISPNDPTRANTLTATVSATDADGDAITFYYDWFVNNIQVQTGTTATLAPTFYFEGQFVYVQVRPFDGIAFGATRISTSVVIANSAPLPPTVTITPARPRPGVDNLVCTRTAGSDLDPGDTLTYQMRWRVNGLSVGGATLSGNTLTIPGSMVGAGEIWQCDARTNDGSVWSVWSPVAQVIPSEIGTNSCAAWWQRGERADGWQVLDDGGEPVWGWCDQTTNGGGWTRVLRTDGQELAWGQDTWSIAELAGDADASGVYGPFASVRGFSHVMLKQVEGPQAGRFAAYALAADPGDLTLMELLEACRDEVIAPGDDAAFDRPRLIGHTSYASGQRFAGDLAMFDPRRGVTAPDWFFLCGVNETGDNDVSYLAFANATGDANDWLGWWGPAQPGTLWSFASGPYGGPGATHLGGPGIVSFAGWKGDPMVPETWWHAGTYEVYVR